MNKSAIASRFSRAAGTYDAAAQVQRAMAERLAGLLPAASALGEGEIVELGCGTGLLTRRLTEQYPGRKLTAIDLAPGMIEYCRGSFIEEGDVHFEVADAETYRPAGPVALAASNCAFQWLEDPAALLERIGGWGGGGIVLAVGTLLPGSLEELRRSYAAARGMEFEGLELWDEIQWQTELERAGWRPEGSLLVENRETLHDDPLDVMRSLKSIGAGPLSEGRAPLTPKETRAFRDHYRTHFTDEKSGRSRATYRTLYVLARREAR